MLPRYKVLNAAIDHMPMEQVRRMQSQRLCNMVQYVYDNTLFWKKKFDAAGLRPQDIHGIEDLGKIPFCTKEELQQDQAEYPPFGSYTASHRSTWVKYFATSGTTGRPLKRVFSQRDWNYLLERYMRNSAIQPGDISILLGPMDGFMGPTATMDSFNAQGAMVIPAGLMESKAKLKLIQEIQPQSVSGTVSYLLYLGELAKKEGIDLPGIKSLKVVTAVGEPGAAIPETRARLLEYWGDVHIHDAYGMTEFFPLAPNCHMSQSLHLANDFVIAEVVDPQTGKPLPEGESGELVLTNIISDTQPLLRYRTRDLVTLDSTPCACGCTNVRLKYGIEGRVDDMIWYKGTNVFPSAVERVLRGDPRFGNEFQILLRREGEKQTLTVKAEVEEMVSGEDYSTLAAWLRQELKEAIKVNVQVELLPVGTLPTTEYKAKRVVDLRHLKGEEG